MAYLIKHLDAQLKYTVNLVPGLLESTYEQCLAYELTQAGIPFKIQQPIPVAYKQINLDCGYRVDLLVDDRLIVELKTWSS
jgi:GxxExxY protein